MAEGKYGPYIVTDLFTDFDLPEEREWERAIMGRGNMPNGQRRRMEHMVWMDSRVIPGAFYAEAVWFWPQAQPKIINPEATKSSPGIPPHKHSFPELLSYYGTDMDHPEELYCQVEFWLEDEKYVFDKSFVCYIPAGVTHCPLKMHNMTRPIFHFTMGPGLKYT